MARWSLEHTKALHQEGHWVWLENSGDTCLWDFDEAKELEREEGMEDLYFHNFMHGGKRRKFTRMRANIRNL